MHSSSNIPICFLIACLAIFNTSSSQELPYSDTLGNDSAYIMHFHESEFAADTHDTYALLLFHNTHRYQLNISPMPYFGIGNPGHAAYNPVFTAKSSGGMSAIIAPAFNPYLRQPDNITYYRNQPPATNLQYVTGAKQEEFFRLEHARNFGSNLNMSMKMIRQGSTGFYNHLKNSGSYFDISTNYNTANGRYTLLASYYYNKKTLEENGGYEDFGAISNPETAQSSRLDLASNMLRDEGFAVNQTLGLGKVGMKDSISIIPLFRLAWRTHYSGGYRFYSDQGIDAESGKLDTSVYNSFYFDSTQTRDSIVFTALTNQGGLYVYPFKSSLGVYVRHEIIGYDQNHLVDTIYQNQYAGAEFWTSEKPKYGAKISAEYGLNGYDKGNYRARARLEKRLRDSIDFMHAHAGVGLSSEVPAFYYHSYFSNNVRWTNQFLPQQKQYLDAHVGAFGYVIEMETGTMKNYLYFNSNELPDQFKGSIQYFSLGFEKIWQWKLFHIDSRFRYQQFSRNDLIPLPRYLIWESFYLQHHVFNKVLKFQVGADLYFYPSHYGYGYTPYLGQFHLQQSQKVGDYPYIDVFLNARLKRAFFFLKMSHFNKGMSGNDYFQVPDYPAPGRSFKFGIRWILFD